MTEDKVVQHDKPESSELSWLLGVLRNGTIKGKVQELEEVLQRCTLCPHHCLNNRLLDV
jgi:hypothetical protein